MAAEELEDAIVAAFEEALTTGYSDAVRRAEAAEILMGRVEGRPVQPSEEVTGVGHPPGDPGHAQG